MMNSRQNMMNLKMMNSDHTADTQSENTHRGGIMLFDSVNCPPPLQKKEQKNKKQKVIVK